MTGAIRAFCMGCLLGAIVGGLSVDRCSRGPVIPPVAALEVRTAPNDVVLEVKPGAKPSMSAPTAARGGKVSSTTEITVAGGEPVPVPKPETIGSEPSAVVKECLTAEDFTCPPVRVRIDILTLDDGQQYAAVIAPDGNEVTGVHIPLIPAEPTPLNRVGAYIGDGATVLTYTRDWGRRISLGVAATVIDGRVTPAVGGEWRY